MVSKQGIALLVAAAVMAVGGAGLASATSIGINFSTGNTANPNLDTLTASQTAGVVAQANWNNVNLGGKYSAGPVALVDSTGAATTATASVTGRAQGYNISETTGTQPDAANGDQILMNGGSYGVNNTSGFGQPDHANGYTVVATVQNVPYATYNVYVYGLVDHGNTNEGLAIGTGTVSVANNVGTFTPTSVVYETTPTPNAAGYIDGTTASGFTYTQATSTNANLPTAGADYAEFTGVTGSSFAVGALYGSNASPAIEGIQIVAVPEPASVGLLCVGAAALLLIKKRKTA